MSPAQIDRFFKILSEETDRPITVILTGAAAGALMGNVRPSLDIDFAVTLSSSSAHPEKEWPALEEAVQRTSQKTGIAVNFSADLDRWSSIALLDYAHHTKPYQRFGRVVVRILEPPYWAIGKLSRFVQSDLDDLRRVLKAQSPPWRSTVALWGKALKSSPPSTSCFQFRQHVEQFLRSYAQEVWGAECDPAQAIQEFHRAAGVRAKPG